MYTLYHIPGKKWGCTKQKLSRRLWQQGLSINDVDKTITIENMDKASDMEMKLNLEYGYGWNSSRDYREIVKNRKNTLTPEARLKGALKGGKAAVESGQLKSICSMGGKVGGKIAGYMQSQKEYTCPTCNKTGRGNRFVSHIKNCIK